MFVYKHLYVDTITSKEHTFLNLLTHKVQKLNMFTMENGKLLSSFLICFILTLNIFVVLLILNEFQAHVPDDRIHLMADHTIE